MSQAQRSPLHVTWDNAIPLDNETRPKFFALKNVCWIKLQDFMDIVPRHPHLSGIRLQTRPMVMHDFPFGKGERSELERKKVERESETNGALVNGYR